MLVGMIEKLNNINKTNGANGIFLATLGLISFDYD